MGAGYSGRRLQNPVSATPASFLRDSYDDSREPSPGGDFKSGDFNPSREEGNRESGIQEQLAGFYSKYFIIPKKDGGLRPILDLRQLNAFLKVLPFRMLTTQETLVSIEGGEWFTSLNLKDAYFHVPIWVGHRPFLRFAFQGQAFQFRVLPFGLALSPRVFTRVVAAALAPLQAAGLKILPYLDDWLVCSPDRSQASRDTQRVMGHIQNLGFRVNFKKSNLNPTQDISFLGLRLNSGRLGQLGAERVG